MARVQIGNVYPSDEYLMARCAPAGYGLGRTAAPTSNLDTALKCGWYSFGSDCYNRPVDFGVVLVLNRYDTEIVQIAFDVAMEEWKENGAIARRVYHEGAWDEWEYINPPMMPGVEYRTTERWQGKPVYYKMVDFGGLPNATTATVPIGAENIEWVFLDLTKSWAGLASDLTTNYLAKCSKITDMSVDAGKISITTNENMTGTLAYIMAKYTKSTD